VILCQTSHKYSCSSAAPV